MESGVLAATGRLRGCVRAISDTPAEPLARSRLRSRPTGGHGRSVPEGARHGAGRHGPRAANVRRALKALEGAA